MRASRYKGMSAKVRPVISTLWAVFATGAALFLGWRTYSDGAALARLEGRDKLDAFMTQVRRDYLMHCIEETEALRPLHASRFQTLIEVAGVDVTSPPYDAPCRRIAAPGPVGGLSIESRPIKTAPAYESWAHFDLVATKKAVLWIEDVPLPFSISMENWDRVKTNHAEMLAKSRQCTTDENAKSEHAFAVVQCYWALDEKFEPRLYRVETLRRPGPD